MSKAKIAVTRVNASNIDVSKITACPISVTYLDVDDEGRFCAKCQYCGNRLLEEDRKCIYCGAPRGEYR